MALYLTDALGYTEALALTIYHVWVALCYFTPVIGAILADSFLGKFRTIFWHYSKLDLANVNYVLSVLSEEVKKCKEKKKDLSLTQGLSSESPNLFSIC